MTTQPDDRETQARRRLIEAMPKAELHLHLDGSLRVDTALELARTRGIDAPTDWTGMSAALIAPMPCADQAELLRAFDLPIALMQDAEALERITRELVETKAADGVRYVEIRWGPRLHVARGLSLADGIAAVCAGARDGAARTGTVVRLICTALRSHDPEGNVELAETAARFLDEGLTGWDLAGPEAAFPDPLDHARAFEAARANGLRITIHAGEWGGAAQVRRALVVEPERIAHGPVTIDDPGPVRRAARPRHLASTCARPRTGRPASSRRSRRIRWPGSIAAGVPVTLNTDDTTVSDITLSEEYVERGRADRADAARAVGHRPAGARCRLRRRGDARARCERPSTPGPPGIPELWRRASPARAVGSSVVPLGYRARASRAAASSVGVGGDRGRPLVGGEGLDLAPASRRRSA